MATVVPVRVYLFTLQIGARTVTPRWTSRSAQEAITGANRIWSVARISFQARSVTSESVRLPGASGRATVDRAGFFFLGSRYGRHPQVTLGLVRAVAESELGGEAVREINFALLPWSSSASQRSGVLAHEFGHLLGLGHVSVRRGPGQSGAAVARSIRNLMNPGLRSGNELTPDQIRQAQQSALGRRSSGAHGRH